MRLLRQLLRPAAGRVWPRRAPIVRAVDYQRVIIDGEEILVRRIIRITDDEIVYEDPYGNIRTVRRRRRQGILALTPPRAPGPAS